MTNLNCTENRPVLSKRDSIVTLKTAPVSARDPFVLHHDGVYYVYISGWTVMRSLKDDLASGFTQPEVPALRFPPISLKTSGRPRCMSTRAGFI